MGAAGVPEVLSGATILGGEGSTSLISSYSCCVAMAAGIVVSASGIAARGIWCLLGGGGGGGGSEKVSRDNLEILGGWGLVSWQSWILELNHFWQ